jgi:hypothetical protein
MKVVADQSKNVELAERQIVKRFKEGRGSGSGQDYRPFLTVRDVPSTGRVHRLPSATVGRIHHLLSDLEYHVFCQLDWHMDVSDIREQFPIPRNESRRIAEKLGIAHPSVGGVDQVMTTDFIVDLDQGGRSIIKAISAKYSDELDDARVLEKLELERSYWAEKDIAYAIVTEKEIPHTLVENIKWIRPYLNSLELTPTDQKEYFAIFQELTGLYGDQKIARLATKLDGDYNTQSGTHLSVLRHLLAQSAFSFDMENISVKNLTCQDLIPSEFWLTEKYEYVVGE